MSQGVNALQMKVDVRKLRIGSVRLFVAPVGTSWVPNGEVFNVDTPPTGWRDLGGTTEETSLEAAKEVFSLRTGILKTVKFQAVIGMEGKLNVKLQEFDAEAVADAMGSARPFNILKPTPTASSIETATSKTSITLATGEGANFSVGDRVVVDEAAKLTTTPNVATIQAIETDTLTFVAPGLPTPPLDTMVVQAIYARKNAIGTTVVAKHALLAVHDLVGGAQYVYLLPEVSAIESGFKPELHESKENAKLPITFNAYGVTDPDFNDTVVALQFEIE